MRRLLQLLLLLLPNGAIAYSPPSPSHLCDTAIASAERIHRLPPRLLGAIAQVESGRPDDTGKIRPWPWTINAEGHGQFFASKQQAIAAVHTLQLRGMRSIDVGCMQINLMHHPDAFASLDVAFDPTANALYAARFLNQLYGDNRSWLLATAAYHSQTPAIGDTYRQRVEALWQHPGSAIAGRGLQTAFRGLLPPTRVYGAFQPSDRQYGDFADSTPARR